MGEPELVLGRPTPQQDPRVFVGKSSLLKIEACVRPHSQFPANQPGTWLGLPQSCYTQLGGRAQSSGSMAPCYHPKALCQGTAQPQSYLPR